MSHEITRAGIVTEAPDVVLSQLYKRPRTRRAILRAFERESVYRAPRLNTSPIRGGTEVRGEEAEGEWVGSVHLHLQRD